MAEDDFSESESHESDSDSSSEELETPGNGGRQRISEYEKQRMKRIEENRARMQALGLPKMASSLMGSVQEKKKKKIEPKGKRKMVEEDDEEYRPPEGEQGLSSSSDDDDDDNEKLVGVSPIGKVKKKTSNPKKKASIQKFSSNSDFVDDNDDDLMKAIALSLKDCAGFLDVGRSGPSKTSEAHVIDGMQCERKENANIQEDTGKRKRKKPIGSRVQMTEDELVVHFFHFDETGKGSINVKDLQRVAAAHDFTWTDKEMVDMIYCFDSDGDRKGYKLFGNHKNLMSDLGSLCIRAFLLGFSLGANNVKLSLEDFRKIVGRCNMIRGSENAAVGSKS